MTPNGPSYVVILPPHEGCQTTIRKSTVLAPRSLFLFIIFICIAPSTLFNLLSNGAPQPPNRHPRVGFGWASSIVRSACRLACRTFNKPTFDACVCGGFRDG